ncbi:MAG: Pilin/Flagellin PilA family [Candidatus Methanohalarchaeum thermophilum]|uniref:Pilin/Flagellin PilA family n=1 Tax=Methanohalarchaeum thermophilum TaxID=1903181 RepID=A0A1Q6DWF3_METT1|nr:MAG: Pilin/Flagellin PilA family [Candidatus Methanohalarchaeum thermophilum]
MKKQPNFLCNRTGVSPVIGVILMVAITVIMAAIVAGFVFGVIQTPQATPTASITISNIVPENKNEHNGTVTLLHQGGDDLNTSNTKVIITDLEDGDTWTFNQLQDLNKDGVFSAGERIKYGVLPLNDFADSKTINNGDGGITEGHKIEVRVIDSVSGGVISVQEKKA